MAPHSGHVQVFSPASLLRNLVAASGKCTTSWMILESRSIFLSPCCRLDRKQRTQFLPAPRYECLVGIFRPGMRRRSFNSAIAFASGACGLLVIVPLMTVALLSFPFKPVPEKGRCHRFVLAIAPLVVDP